MNDAPADSNHRRQPTSSSGSQQEYYFDFRNLMLVTAAQLGAYVVQVHARTRRRRRLRWIYVPYMFMRG